MWSNSKRSTTGLDDDKHKLTRGHVQCNNAQGKRKAYGSWLMAHGLWLRERKLGNGTSTTDMGELVKRLGNSWGGGSRRERLTTWRVTIACSLMKLAWK